MRLRRQNLIIFQHVNQWLEPRRGRALATVVQSQPFQQSLALARVGLILDPALGPTYHLVEDGEFFAVAGGRTQPTAFLKFVLLLEQSLKPIYLNLRPTGRKVIPMNNERYPNCSWWKTHGEDAPWANPISSSMSV